MLAVPGSRTIVRDVRRARPDAQVRDGRRRAARGMSPGPGPRARRRWTSSGGGGPSRRKTGDAWRCRRSATVEVGHRPWHRAAGRGGPSTPSGTAAPPPAEVTRPGPPRRWPKPRRREGGDAAVVVREHGHDVLHACAADPVVGEARIAGARASRAGGVGGRGMPDVRRVCPPAAMPVDHGRRLECHQLPVVDHARPVPRSASPAMTRATIAGSVQAAGRAGTLRRRRATPAATSAAAGSDVRRGDG